MQADNYNREWKYLSPLQVEFHQYVLVTDLTP